MFSGKEIRKYAASVSQKDMETVPALRFLEFGVYIGKESRVLRPTISTSEPTRWVRLLPRLVRGMELYFDAPRSLPDHPPPGAEKL